MSEQECDTCGNEWSGGGFVCPYCGARCSLPSPARAPVRQARVQTVNLEEGMPVVDKALSRLDDALERATFSNVAVLRIIHGYGSGGKGGRIREAARHQLASLKHARLIRAVFPGEQWSSRNPDIKRLFKSYPALARSERTDSRNPGITFVVL